MKINKYRFLVQGIQRINTFIQQTNNTNEIKQYQLTYQYSNNTYTIKLPYFDQFKKIYNQNNILNLQTISEDFHDYLQLPSQVLGKRSSKIIISKSHQFCLKMIEDYDLKKIQSMLFEQNSLLQRFKQKQPKQQNSNCLITICCIFVVDYVISGVKLCDRFILMPNIRCQFDYCIKTFDIKGHLQSRAIVEEDCRDFKFGKDENFVVSQELKIIKKQVGKERIRNMIEMIEENVEFLRKNNVIDYSLLISVEKKKQKQQKKQFSSLQGLYQKIELDENLIIKYAIIDYFQEYNQKKKMQNKFFTLFKKSVSSVEPEIYSKRLIDFLKKYLLQ